MTLFDHSREGRLRTAAPLAERMRPRNVAELAGQEHVIGPGTVLRQSIESGHVPSLILWGPPGTGKTTLASLIASRVDAHFERISAVASGVADLRRVVSESQDRLGMHDRRTVLFIDEIHRFSKSQQDVILPYVENGTVTLIGATTENPSFEVISPLLSRARVYVLKALTPEQIEGILDSAMSDGERGLAYLNPKLEENARDALVGLSNGDARIALNTLELAVNGTNPSSDGERVVTVSAVEDAMQRSARVYDKGGDSHYDTISAFIKSVRASDPDAAVYWLARMLNAGEDPLFVARRMVILAAEDIGLADPGALPMAVAAHHAVQSIGMPEGRIPLSEAAIYLATAPKSNSAYLAIDAAMRDAERTSSFPVPLHLRNAVTSLMKDMGYGKDYKYAHNHEGHFTPTENLPPGVGDDGYYTPSDQGYEARVSERLEAWWGDRGSADG